jgi:hypothetical protein
MECNNCVQRRRQKRRDMVTNESLTNFVEESSQYRNLKNTNQEISKNSVVDPYTRGISKGIRSIRKKMFNMEDIQVKNNAK